MAGKTQGNADVAETTTGTITGPSAFQLLVSKMGQMASLTAVEGRGPRGEDINPILTAETEEEMWDADELARWNAQKLSGCHLQVVGFSVNFAPEGGDIKTNPFIDPATGKEMFLLIDSFRINNAGNTKEYNLPQVGELFVWNTSARNIVGKFFWMLNHGWFDTGAKPVRLMIQGTDIGGGRSVEKLKPLPGNVVIEAEIPLIADDAPANEPPF